MSSGLLMPCVRKSTPPTAGVNCLEESGPLSLPLSNSDVALALSSKTSAIILTPSMKNNGMSEVCENVTTPNVDQQKRRRFHPLRNLRRMFRRRTITTPATVAALDEADSIASSSRSAISPGASNKSVRSATLPSVSLSTAGSQSTSSTTCTSSSLLSQEQFMNVYLTQTLPKIKTPPYLSFLTNNSAFHHRQEEYLSGRSPNETKLPSQSSSKHKQKSSKLQKAEARFQGFSPEASEENLLDISHLHLDNLTDMSISIPNASTSNTSITVNNSSYITSTQSYKKLQYSSAKLKQTQGYDYSTPTSSSKRIPEARQRSVLGHSTVQDKGLSSTASVRRQDLGIDLSYTADIPVCSSEKNGKAVSCPRKGQELLDTQRNWSLSEGHLMESDYLRHRLSQSHDSVFLEPVMSGTLKAIEGQDALHAMRRQVNPVSEQNLAKSCSPSTFERRNVFGQNQNLEKSNATHGLTTSTPINCTKKMSGSLPVHSGGGFDLDSGIGGTQSEVSLSLQSISNSFDNSKTTAIGFNGELNDERDFQTHRSEGGYPAAISTFSSYYDESTNIDSKDSTSLCTANLQKLSHSAAKHKMAIRPTNRKAPSRQKRNTSSKTLLPDESNEGEETIAPNVDLSHAKERSPSSKLQNNTETNVLKLEGKVECTEHANNQFNDKSKTLGLVAPSAAPKMLNKHLYKSQEIAAVVVSSQRVQDTSDQSSMRRVNIQLTNKRTLTKTEDGEGTFDHRSFLSSDSHQVGFKKRQMAPTTEYSNSSSKFSNKLFEESNHQQINSVFEKSTNTSNAFIGGNLPSSMKEKRELLNVKARSGPAARQRYLPQNLLNETTSNSTTLIMDAERRRSSEKYNSEVGHKTKDEIFQSISIIKEIRSTLMRPPSQMKPEIHFEKKPKIIGGAIQQSVNSLFSSDENVDLFVGKDSRHRKMVEKSKSFRDYGLPRSSSPSPLNNMPSLPNLTINLHIPLQKSIVINSPCAQKELLEDQNNSKNITTPIDGKGLSSSDITLTQKESAVVSMKSNRVTKISNRKANDAAGTSMDVAMPILNKTPSSNNVSMATENFGRSGVRKNSIKTIGKTNVGASLISGQREKLLPNTVMDAIDNGVKQSVRPPRKLPLNLEGGCLRETSAAETTINNSNSSNCNNVPEFMKIQLNRVDPARISKSHVVLSKNIKENRSATKMDQCKSEGKTSQGSALELNMRRLSNESVDINENDTLMEEKLETPALETNDVPSVQDAGIGHPIKTIHKRSLLIDVCSPSSSESNIKSTVGRDSRPSTTGKMQSLTLQERCRIFMNDEQQTAPMAQKPSAISEERRKSPPQAHESTSTAKKTMIDYSKNNGCGNQVEQHENGGESTVCMRKKPSISTHSNEHGGDKMNGISNSNVEVSDDTPELMKVFARRSLKLKDEDIDKMLSLATATKNNVTSTYYNGCNNSAQAAGNPVSASNKKLQNINAGSSRTINHDSDKENQSCSYEKLDKIPLDVQEPALSVSSSLTDCAVDSQETSETSTLKESRPSEDDKQPTNSSLKKTLHNRLPHNNVIRLNQQNLNNNQSCNATMTMLASARNTVKVSLKLAAKGRVGAAVNTSVSTLPLDRSDITTMAKNIGSTGSSSPGNNFKVNRFQGYRNNVHCDSMQPPVQSNHLRTDTQVSTPSARCILDKHIVAEEFKGIHQRRAEWEQRVKGSYK